MRLASWVRDFTSSFRNTFPKWYSTVLGLMNSCAAISRLVCPCATRREIWASCGVSWSRRVRHPCHGHVRPSPAARSGPARRTLPCRNPEEVVCDPQLFARVEPATFASQPLAVEQPSASEVHSEPRRLETVDRLPVELLGIVPARQQSPRPRFDAERPRRAARAARRGQDLQRLFGAVIPTRAGRPPRSTRPTRSSRTRARVDPRSPARPPPGHRRIAPDRCGGGRSPTARP